MHFRMRGERLEGRWKTALAARRLADGSTDVVSPDTGVAVPEDGRSGVARRSRTKGTPRAWSCSPAVFTLSRTGDAASALTVTVSVSEDGAVLSGTPASAVTFGAGSDEATLSAATDDDSVAEEEGDFGLAWKSDALCTLDSAGAGC